MINLRVVVLFLSSFCRKEHLGHALAAEHLNEFAAVIERAIVENALHEQGIADIVLFVIGRVPEEVLVLVYNLLS